MKKVYTKPEMEIVSFSLEENIASEITNSTPITKVSSLQKNFSLINY